jgi:uncharacterized protein with HEPN domain
MKEDKVRLGDILKAIKHIETFVAGKTFLDLDEDMLTKSALMAQLMIIGEAAKSVSDKTKAENNEIEWTQIVGLRNVLIHEYFGVMWEIVWNTIKKDLPVLKEQIEHILVSLQ